MQKVLPASLMLNHLCSLSARPVPPVRPPTYPHPPACSWPQVTRRKQHAPGAGARGCLQGKVQRHSRKGTSTALGNSTAWQDNTAGAGLQQQLTAAADQNGNDAKAGLLPMTEPQKSQASAARESNIFGIKVIMNFF